MSRILPWHKNTKLIDFASELSLIAVNKPCNLLSHPNTLRDPSILRASYDFRKECFYCGTEGSKMFTPVYLLHRLDKATSGILLLATTFEVAEYVKRLFKSRSVRKKYVAIAHSPTPIPWKKQSWQDVHRFQRNGENQTAKTDVTVLRYDENRRLAHLLLEPKTGFTHQLRIQCSMHGLPIVGDDIHGAFATDKALFQANSFPSKLRRLYLHAESICIGYNFGGVKKDAVFSASIPDEFEEIISKT